MTQRRPGRNGPVAITKSRNTTDPTVSAAYGKPIDAQRWTDDLTPVDMSGYTSTAETVRRRQAQGAAAKMRALAGALDGPRPDLGDALKRNREIGGTAPASDLLLAYLRERAAAKAAASQDEADALARSRRRIKKRLAQGHPPARAMADAFGKYRRLGGRLTLEEWARRAG